MDTVGDSSEVMCGGNIGKPATAMTAHDVCKEEFPFEALSFYLH